MSWGVTNRSAPRPDRSCCGQACLLQQVGAQGGPVDDRGHAYGDHRHAQSRHGPRRGGGCPHRSRGSGPCPTELHRGAQPLAAAGGQGVDGDDGGGPDCAAAAPLYQLQRLQPRRGPARPVHRAETGGEALELAGQCADHVPCHQQVLHGDGADGVAGSWHGCRAPLPGPSTAPHVGQQRRAAERRDTSTARLKKRLLPLEAGGQVHGDIAACGLAQSPGRLRRRSRMSVHGIALAAGFPAAGYPPAEKIFWRGRPDCRQPPAPDRYVVRVIFVAAAPFVHTKCCGLQVAWPPRNRIYAENHEPKL